MIMYPFAGIILWSLILGMAFYPIHKKLSGLLGGRLKLASFIIVISVLIVVILPTALMIDSLFDEVKELKTNYDNGTLSIPPPNEKVKDWPVVGETLFNTWQTADTDMEKVVIKYREHLTSLGSKLAKGILSAAGGVVQILISLIIAGIILTFGGTGDEILKFFRKIAGNRGDEFAEITMKTVGNVVKGIIGVALILAVLHGIAFMIAGVPYAGIWTLLIFVLAVLQIPLFFITLPVIIYLFTVKSMMGAIIWTIVLLVIGMSDNVLRPILLGKGAPVPMVVIFIGVIGGFIFSGFTGLFTGAIVLSVGYKLFIGWINSTDEKESILQT